MTAADYVTLEIVSGGELFSIQREAPAVFPASSGPMSQHSALIGTVSRMLEHLCAEMWRAEKGFNNSGGGEVRQCGTCIESQSKKLPVSSVCRRCHGHELWLAEPKPHSNTEE